MDEIEKRARELLAAEVDLDAELMPEVEGAKEVAASIRDGGDGNLLFVPTALRAIIAALSAEPKVPEGWVLVPVKPSDSMVGAGCMELADSLGGYESGQVYMCWSAMLAAAEREGQHGFLDIKGAA